MKKWLIRIAFVLLAIPLIIASVIYFGFRASLPELDGSFQTSEIKAPVSVERDERGNATITATNRTDLSYVTGFVHAQERFFQMDLSRRLASGELSALFGSLALNVDRSNRVHRFRHRAGVAIEYFSDTNRQILEQYVKGVNDGLAALGSKPFEYWLIGSEPQAWTKEDTLLVVYSMFFTLQNSDGGFEWQRHLFKNSMPKELIEFLLPDRTQWDAPIQKEEPFEPLDIPSATLLEGAPLASIDRDDTPMLGSNSWAVSGNLTENGAGMVSNDMHLDIRSPSIWYKMRLKLSDGSLDITGVTLPGTPAIVVGSNGHIAWGFTNSNIDHSDLIDLKINPANENQYLTNEGYKDFIDIEETINISDGSSEKLLIKETIWGPVITMPDGSQYAYRWVAHMPDGVNMGLLMLEQAMSVNAAVDAADQMAIPAQNMVVVDKEGNLAWTLYGKIARRDVGDYTAIQDWSDGKGLWNGWYSSQEYPREVNPDDDRLWTANARTVTEDDFAKIGFSRYDLGARADQIKKRLFELSYPIEEKDLYGIMMDDEAMFLQRWQEQLVAVLEHADEDRFAPILAEVKNWGGKADKKSIGFRLVKEYRSQVFKTLMANAVRACVSYNEECRYSFATKQWEQPLWQLVSERPSGWLPDGAIDWQFYFEQQAFEAWKPVMLGEVELQDYTWGARNMTNIAHPLSGAVGDFAKYINMPNVQQSGDSENIPFITGREKGQSIRMVVSPGYEDDGMMDLPSGQSAHPLSPYFGAGHQDWLDGKMSPFLPGETEWMLEFLPAE